MSQSDIYKLAEDYVLEHKDRFKADVSDSEIKTAVEQVAKALQELQPDSTYAQQDE